MNTCHLMDVLIIIKTIYIYIRFKLELLVLSDNSSNGQITDLMELLTEQMKNTNDDFTDMRKVFGFMTPKNGLQLYFVDGTGYS